MLSVSSRVAQTIDGSAGNRKQGPPWCPCPRPMGCEPGMTSVLALPGGRTIHLVKPVIFCTLLSIAHLAIVAPGEKQSQQPPSCRDLPPFLHMVPADGFLLGLKDSGDGSVKSTGRAGDAAQYPGRLLPRDGAGLGSTLLAEGFTRAGTR